MNSPEEPQWWVAINQKTEGPFTIKELQALSKSQKIGSQTMACPLDGQVWSPLWQINQLAALPPGGQQTPQPVLPQPNPYEAPARSTPTYQTFTASSQMSAVALVVSYYCLFWVPIFHGIQIVHALISAEDVATELATELILLQFVIAKVFVLFAAGTLGVLAGLAWKNCARRAVWLTISCFALNLLLQWTGFWLIRMYVAAVIEFVGVAGPEAAAIQTGGFDKFLLILDVSNLLMELAILGWIIFCHKKLAWSN